jgi:hypothetical protein
MISWNQKKKLKKEIMQYFCGLEGVADFKG